MELGKNGATGRQPQLTAVGAIRARGGTRWKIGLHSVEAFRRATLPLAPRTRQSWRYWVDGECREMRVRAGSVLKAGFGCV